MRTPWRVPRGLLRPWQVGMLQFVAGFLAVFWAPCMAVNLWDWNTTGLQAGVALLIAMVVLPFMMLASDGAISWHLRWALYSGVAVDVRSVRSEEHPLRVLRNMMYEGQQGITWDDAYITQDNRYMVFRNAQKAVLFKMIVSC